MHHDTFAHGILARGVLVYDMAKAGLFLCRDVLDGNRRKSRLV